MKKSNFTKLYQRTMCLGTAIILAISLCGCSSDSMESFIEDIAKYVMVEFLDMDPFLVDYQFAPASYVLFFEDKDSAPQYVLLSEIEGYESQFADCNSTWYRDQLSQEDRIIYNAHLYAMEHCLKGFQLIVADSDKDFFHIRDMLALDSPFLEQNVNSEGEYVSALGSTEYGDPIFFYMDQYAPDRWALKQQALESCRQAIADIPDQCDTQEAKMLYLYHYVCDKITYTEYDNLADQNYLYDAAILGETVCDGYSNMLSLLFNLIGVDACEAMGVDEQLPEDATEEDIDDYDGHTWVIAKLGENYYHFDPTFEDTIEQIQEERTIYFGISDAMASCQYIDYDTMRPACPDTSRDLTFVHLTLPNITEQNHISELAKLTDQRTRAGNYITYVMLEVTIDEDQLDAMLNKYIQKVYAIESVNVMCCTVNDQLLMKFTTEPW